MKKRIVWITPDCFLDVDLPIIKELQSYYDIYWQIVIGFNNTIDYESYVASMINSQAQVEISFYYQKYRLRDIRNIYDYIKIINKVKSYNPDIYYLSFAAIPYGILIYRMFLPLNKCVVACHNVSTPQGAMSGGIAKKYTYLWLKYFKNIQVFSKGQKKVLDSKHPNKNVLMAPLAIKDYGIPTRSYDRENMQVTRFLIFGNIVEYKRVDLLIEAGNTLYKRGVKDFKIRIAGNGNVWKKYASLIKYPDIFELYIKRIPNEEVADLFADSHYFVMPYQDIAQSGAITVAFRYNLPTLVSDIDQFKEFVTDGVTGVTFKNKDAQDLADKMQYMIEQRKEVFPKLAKAQADYVEKELSLKSIIDKYIYYLDRI